MNANRAYQFVDTNLLVYALDASAGTRHERAAALQAELWENRTGCLSTQVLEELCVTVTRKVARPLDFETAQQVVEDLAHWRVHTPRAADVVEAIRIHRQYGILFWDALIIRSAACLGCEILWSEDLDPGQVYAGVRVQNPFLPASH